MPREETESGPEEQVAAKIQALNLDFYRLDPSSYLLFRLRNLVLSAGRGLELEQLLVKGVKVGVFELSAPESSWRDSLDQDEREEQDAFVTLETEVLLHHVCETLLRLYLAHEHSPPCPWLSVSRERSPRRFKTKVSALGERVKTPGGEKDLARVFFGAPDHAGFGDADLPEEKWAELVENSRVWLTWFAGYMLDGDVYNAAKHGLAVYSRRSAVKVEVDGKPFMEGSGPCLEFLRSVRREDGQRQWQRTTKWVHWDRLFGAIHIGCQLIDRMWTVARVHYGESERLDLQLRIFASPGTF
jgi:hypothetical protein